MTLGPVKKKKDRLFQALKPYLIDTLVLRHWFYYYVPEGYNKKIFIFRSCEETKNIILELFPNLYVDIDKCETALEDICFFKDKKLFLGTVSHEEWCCLYPPTEEIASRFNAICKWKQEKDDLDEQIEIEL